MVLTNPGIVELEGAIRFFEVDKAQELGRIYTYLAGYVANFHCIGKTQRLSLIKGTENSAITYQRTGTR